MPKKTMKPAVNKNGYTSGLKKDGVTLRDIEFDRETTPDREEEFTLGSSLQNFNGKRVVYIDPNTQATRKKEDSPSYIDIEVTDSNLKFVIPCDHEFVMKPILNMLSMPMEGGTGDKLTFSFDDARFLQNTPEGIRTYYFEINENTMPRIKQNLIFVIASSGIRKRYGIRGIGVYERNQAGRLVRVSNEVLAEWLVSL